MNGSDDIESYTSVNDNYVPLIIYVVCSLAFFAIIDKIVKPSGNILDAISFILVLTGIFFQALRSRTCPICGVKMYRYFNGQPLPKYHYCDICKTKIHTIVRNRTN